MSFLKKLFGNKNADETDKQALQISRARATNPKPSAFPPSSVPPPPPQRPAPKTVSVSPGARLSAGRYEVAGEPLKGGMGIVYPCFDHQEQRPVALKTFKPEYLSKRDRFLQEGATWVRLGKHPHIVRCYDVFQDTPRLEVYLALELIAKEVGRRDASLRSWLVPGRPLPVDQALLIALQIARGMAHASAVIPGFVHRDLKPENVLVGADRLSNAAINRVRVTDFGLVRELQDAQVTAELAANKPTSMPGRLTQPGALLGTAEYMAPEQWEDLSVTAQADIYAFGCILGEMITGRMLVYGEPRRGLGEAHKRGAALAAVQNAPASLRELLGCCLATEHSQRYASWSVVEAALAAAYCTASGQPPPELEATDALNRAERVATGWSHNDIGYSYLQMGNPQAALGYFQRAHEAGRVEMEPHLMGTGLTHLGSTYDDLGDFRRAIDYHEWALAIAREIGSRGGEGEALTGLGHAYKQLGDARRSLSYYEQALAIAREIGDRQGEGATLTGLGHAYLHLGDARPALSSYEQALAISRMIGDRHSEGIDLGNLGCAYAELGDLRRAIGFFEQALAIWREIGDRHGEGRDLDNLGSTYAALGDARRAIGYHERALRLLKEIGDRRGEGAALGNLGIAYRQLRDARRAISYYEQALAISRMIGTRRSEGTCLSNLGCANAELGDPRRAIGYFEAALAISREIGDRSGEGTDLGYLGSAYADLGDSRRAITFFEQALTILQELGYLDRVASFSFNMALLYAKQGDRQRALSLAREAVRLGNQVGHAAYVQRAQQLVAQLER